MKNPTTLVARLVSCYLGAFAGLDVVSHCDADMLTADKGLLMVRVVV